MLSNTADTKPSPIATCHDASGSLCTGIIDAASTSDSRNTAPRERAGQLAPSAGARSGTQTRIATQTAAPMNGNGRRDPLKLDVDDDVDDDRGDQDQRDDEHARPVDATPAGASRDDRRVALLLQRRRDAEDHQRERRGDVGLEHRSGDTPSIHIIVVVVSPTTLPEPPAFDAATIAAR